MVMDTRMRAYMRCDALAARVRAPHAAQASFVLFSRAVHRDVSTSRASMRPIPSSQPGEICSEMSEVDISRQHVIHVAVE